MKLKRTACNFCRSTFRATMFKNLKRNFTREFSNNKTHQKTQIAQFFVSLSLLSSSYSSRLKAVDEDDCNNSTDNVAQDFAVFFVSCTTKISLESVRTGKCSLGGSRVAWSYRPCNNGKLYLWVAPWPHRRQTGGYAIIKTCCGLPITLTGSLNSIRQE